MKKKIIMLIIVILIILGVIFLKNKITTKNVEYQLAKVENYNYIKYKENDKFGIIDREGNIIIEAKYNNIKIPNPEKDVFLCYENESEKPVILNSNKQTLFEKYENIDAIKLKNLATTLCYEKTVLKYKKDGLYGLIDFTGKEITKNVYTNIENLQGTEGKFQVEKNQKQGVININGAVLVDSKYDKVQTDGYFNDETEYTKSGFIVSNTTNEGYRYGYISYDGKKVLDTEYNDIIRLEAEDIYLIASKNGQYGLYAESKEVIKPEYQEISYTDNGAIIIIKNGKYGIANLKGEVKVEPKYTEIEERGIYLYAKNVRDNDVYDSNGNKIDSNFNKSIYETDNENYRVTTILNNNILYYGIENKNGEEVVANRYKYIEHICDNFFIVQDENEKYGVITATGTEKIDLEFDLIQKIKNKNIIQVQKANSKESHFYSSKMALIAKITSARVQNQKNYIRIYNDKEEIYLDKDGNKIDKNSEIVKKELQSELPEKIKDYSRMQYSLDDVYYEQ